MCGICGRVNFNGLEPEPKLLRAMCERLMHRGPDDQGIFTAPGIGLGQRRLAVIDLTPEATAPLANEDGSVLVTFNGEIYNHRELRAELIRLGHRFRTQSDTEVLVHLYEEHGMAMVQRLSGMFAFAIWDARARRLFAARDRLGKKPFVYARTPSAFLFASEIKALAVNPEISLQPDFAALDAYLSFQYVPSPLSAFQGIRKLPPASTLECDSTGTVRIARYWAPGAVAKTELSRAEMAGQVRQVLRQAVERRLVADVPVGAFLSGGLDSGSVVALMSEASARPVRTFSIGFEHYQHDELPWARLIAQRYQTDHHEIVIRPNPDVLWPLAYYYNEPFADSSALPTYYVSRFARAEVTVALTGDGGDESFAGYSAYERMRRWRRVDVIPRPVRATMGRGMAALLARLPASRQLSRAQLAAGFVDASVPERYVLQLMTVKPHEKQRWYAREFREQSFAQAASHLDAPPAWDQSCDVIDWMARHDQRFYLPDCLLVKTDIASMAHGLEVRCPLLDHELVELASSIPSAWKLNGKGGKQILKEAMRAYLPVEISNRPKSGFGLPLAQWLRGPFARPLRANLLDGRALRRGILQPEAVRTIVDDHIAGRADWSNRLWAFLMLELWFRRFID